jgi:hypothetical protein
MYEDDNAFGDREGSFEWLIGADYNGNGGIKNAISAFSALAKTRDDLYVLDTSADGIVNIGNCFHTTLKGAQKRAAEVQAIMDEAKLSRFCRVYAKDGFIKQALVNYSPAYVMQNLANMASGVGPITGYDCKGKYAAAKTQFISCFIDGMTHPHMQPTYYLIVQNNFEPLG